MDSITRTLRSPITNPASGGYVVFVEHVIWQDREHAGGELF